MESSVRTPSKRKRLPLSFRIKNKEEIKKVILNLIAYKNIFSKQCLSTTNAFRILRKTERISCFDIEYKRKYVRCTRYTKSNSVSLF
jgi:hypothetical protein